LFEEGLNEVGYIVGETVAIGIWLGEQRS